MRILAILAMGLLLCLPVALGHSVFKAYGTSDMYQVERDVAQVQGKQVAHSLGPSVAHVPVRPRQQDEGGCPADYPFPSSTHPGNFCYNTAAYAAAGTGPCDSWCKTALSHDGGCPGNPVCGATGAPTTMTTTPTMMPTPMSTPMPTPGPTPEPTPMPTPMPTPIPTPMPTPGAHTLILSEVIEGSSYNKVIEIYNPTNERVWLGQYQIRQIFNNRVESENFLTLPFVMLQPGATFTVCNPAAHDSFLQACDTTDRVEHNGNDAIFLVYGDENDYAIIDSFGTEAGGSPGPWDVCGQPSVTANAGIRRKPGIARGNTDWTSSAGTTVDDCEWIVLRGGNNATYTGEHASDFPARHHGVSDSDADHVSNGDANHIGANGIAICHTLHLSNLHADSIAI